MVPDRLRVERDLYRVLLKLPVAEDSTAALRRALHLVVEATSAHRGYLELYGESQKVPRWSIAEGCSEEEVADIQRVTSRGIVGAALASAGTVHTPSALLDERFDKLASVRDQRLEAVLCVPIMGKGVPVGVLYLEAPVGPFAEEDVALVESLSRFVGPVVERVVLADGERTRTDHTASWRRDLALDGIAGRSQALAKVFREVSLWAPREFTVLITGPSGSGKNLLARALHANSPRRGGPMCEVNCAALPDTLVESELFGAVAGAHSTASQRVPGKVEAAEGGTLFLDEIGELPLAAQAKLLQLLQSREYFPLGANKPVRANIRIVAATNADLEERVRERRFREDLLFRVNLATIRMPPLSERLDDVLPVAEFLVSELSRREGLPALPFSPAACEALLSSDWTGNVRALEGAVSRGLVSALHEGARQIEVDHLFSSGLPGAASDQGQTFQQATRNFQRELLTRTLHKTNWNIAETARLLDIARSHVYNLIQAHQLSKQLGQSR